MDKAYPATSIIYINQGTSIELDGLFNYELMVYAAKNPASFYQQLQIATENGYDGTYIIVKFPGDTLPMKFAVKCALTAVRNEYQIVGWVILDMSTRAQ